MASAGSRFVAKYKMREETGCWLWRGFINPGGYGTFWMDGRKVLAHRAVYLLFRGKIPPEFQIKRLSAMPGV